MNCNIINCAFFLGLYLVVSGCGAELKTTNILVELSPGSLILEHKEIDKSSFEKELGIVIDKKMQEGFKKEDLTITLKVDKDTRRGDIGDLETTMRRLNVRKVVYLTFEGRNVGQREL